MPENLPKIHPTSPLGSALNKITQHQREHAITSSQDLKVTNTANGAIVSLSPNLKNFATTYTNYKGEWKRTAGYSVNDVVRVLPTGEYLDDEGEPLGVLPGVYICVASVPDRDVSDTLKGQGWPEGATYIRFDDVNYNPQWPEPEITARDITRYMSPLERAQIRYWELLSLLPMEQSVCVNGIAKTYYVDAAEKPQDTGGV